VPPSTTADRRVGARLRPLLVGEEDEEERRENREFESIGEEERERC